ncbi:hypothetical protein [Bradyrhizobium sp.]|uniref:hypothetical protein n=1 Tax=Bradyrhizobium sp. TaxID=376 RepID=UPI001DAF1CDD|nr:hypothetical protein [Bradyrhizobium sp.]MBI5323112.1 hypothetical protein [Bradyrhizobium sp.]
MLELANRPTPPEGLDRSLPDAVRAFLVESERRVVLHCHKLLDNRQLPGEDRYRLARLSERAEEELRRLGA